jgi:L-fucose isomerase-like protein
MKNHKHSPIMAMVDSHKKSQTPVLLANARSHRKLQASFSFNHHWNSQKIKGQGKKLKHTQTQKCCGCIHNWGTKKDNFGFLFILHYS